MRKIGVLMATVFVDMLGFAMVFPLLPYYAQRFSAEPWQIGWLIAVYSIAQLLVAPLWGRLSDRFGRRPALLVGLAASAGAFLVFGFAQSLAQLFVSRLIQGVGGGTVGVAQAYVGDVIAPEDRGRSLGWLSAASSAGIMIGPAIGSLATSWDHRAPGLIAASLCLLNILFAWIWLREPGGESASGSPPTATDGEASRPIRAMLWEVLVAPRGQLQRLVWVYAVGMLGFMSTTAVLALYLEARFGVTERTIGLFFLYLGGLSLFMRAVALGPLLQRYREAGVMRIGAVCLAIGIAALPLPQTVLGFVAALTLMPIGTACLFPATSAMVSRRASRRELGQALGVQQAFGGAARVLAPLWATWVFQTVGHTVPFFIAAGIVALASLLTLGVTSIAVTAPTLPLAPDQP